MHFHQSTLTIDAEHEGFSDVLNKMWELGVYVRYDDPTSITIVYSDPSLLQACKDLSDSLDGAADPSTTPGTGTGDGDE